MATPLRKSRNKAYKQGRKGHVKEGSMHDGRGPPTQSQLVEDFPSGLKDA